MPARKPKQKKNSTPGKPVSQIEDQIESTTPTSSSSSPSSSSPSSTAPSSSSPASMAPSSSSPEAPDTPDPNFEVDNPLETIEKQDRSAYLTLAMTAFSWWRAAQMARTCHSFDRAFAHFHAREPHSFEKITLFLDNMAKNGSIDAVQEIASFEADFYAAINAHLDKKRTSE
jgi:hypothetical protein